MQVGVAHRASGRFEALGLLCRLIESSHLLHKPLHLLGGEQFAVVVASLLTKCPNEDDSRNPTTKRMNCNLSTACALEAVAPGVDLGKGGNDGRERDKACVCTVDCAWTGMGGGGRDAGAMLADDIWHGMAQMARWRQGLNGGG
jgi:hypothetical protein